MADQMRASHILVVEEEPKIAAALGEGLRGEGYAVTVCATPEQALDLAGAAAFALIVLDRRLSGDAGLEILGAFRSEGRIVPALVLTTAEAVAEGAAAVEGGVDYLVTPFAFADLLARVGALLHSAPADESLRLTVADLVVDTRTRKAMRGRQELDLTPREFELLEYLARHQGQVVSREMLARVLWKESPRGTPLDDVVELQVAHLRKKVDEGFAVRLVHTVRGVGTVLGERTPA